MCIMDIGWCVVGSVPKEKKWLLLNSPSLPTRCSHDFWLCVCGEDQKVLWLCVCCGDQKVLWNVFKVWCGVWFLSGTLGRPNVWYNSINQMGTQCYVGGYMPFYTSVMWVEVVLIWQHTLLLHPHLVYYSTTSTRECWLLTNCSSS